MIYDCFTFLNKNTLLDIRLNTLKDIVDKFVVIESNKTFVGRPKPKNFDERFLEEFPDKIIYVYLEDKLNARNPWENETIQRNYILDVLKQQNCSDDDIILISDIDEIPDPIAIEYYKQNPEGVNSLLQNFYNCYLNLHNCTESPWKKAKILQYKEFFNPENRPTLISSAYIPELNEDITPTCIRLMTVYKSIRGGWHFSYLGGAEAIKYKIENFSHQEFNTPNYTDINIIKERLFNEEDILGRNLVFEKVDIDNSFPKYIVENKEKFKEFILP